MISASIAETHRFGRVRKNGYNPSEVDAVVARLTEVLRRNEERIATLMERIDAADGTVDAIARTFVAAEATRDEIIPDAEPDQATTADQARAEAEELLESITEMRSEMAAKRQSILTEVYEDAEDRMLHIEQQTAQRSADAEWAIRDAIDVRDRTVSELEAEAEAMMHRAEGEAAQIRTRITEMAQAAAALENAAEALAASAQDGAKVIDLTAMEQLDGSVLVAPAPSKIGTPEFGMRAKPVPIAPESTEDTVEEDEMPKTRYQRTTGIPLKERIKIARMSG